MASEILNCDIGKINDYFTNTDLELLLKDRKKSGMSNTDSDLRLSDDHIDKKEEDHKEVEHYDEMTEQAQPETLHHEEIKSINELASGEHVNINEYDNLQKTKIELLDYLLNFIDTDGELNYVLAGYFSKFLIQLLNKHPQRVIGFNIDYELHIW
jgi:hypothetical protein